MPQKCLACLLWLLNPSSFCINMFRNLICTKLCQAWILTVSLGAIIPCDVVNWLVQGFEPQLHLCKVSFSFSGEGTGRNQVCREIFRLPEFSKSTEWWNLMVAALAEVEISCSGESTERTASGWVGRRCFQQEDPLAKDWKELEAPWLKLEFSKIFSTE